MARKCSHCGNCGHNSRTCGGHRDAMLCEGLALRLYGVQRLQVPHAASSASPFKKSYSMPFPPPPPPPFSSLFLPVDEGSERASNGYRAALQERKKGVPWSEEEHRFFLAGLENLGKGDWRGISRSYVTTRTPTQVASHAQKFFLRHNGVAKKKRRRSSLFDMFLVCENGMRVPEPLANGDEARTCLSLNVQCHEFSEKTANDLINHLPGAVLPMEQAHGHGHHCSPLDLELGMCLPRPPEHAVPSSLSTSCSSFIGAVRVN